MSRLRALLAVVGPVLPGCFVDPGVDERPATSTGETGEPGTATTGDDPTTGAEQPPRCGDAIQDPDEQCDYGEQVNGVDGAFCRADCTTNRCGDAYLAVSEDCDDGNIQPGDGCSASCTLEACGDGVVSGREQCDDGNALASDACTDVCERAVCGDGIVQVDVEACDDGNQRDADGCTALCELQVCGDGELDRGEQCDDGNAVDLDGCSAACVLDTRRVFVTSARYTGAFGGLEKADELCQGLARAAGLPGTYLAWLSDAEESPALRMTHSALPYMLVDGTVIAADWDDLIDGALASPINVTELGEVVLGDGCQGANLAWTNTRVNSTALGDLHCFNWLFAGADGRAGSLSAVGSEWTNSCSAPCDAQLHLYCFEQGD